MAQIKVHLGHILAALLVTALAFSASAYREWEPTCDRYLVNVTLYTTMILLVNVAGVMGLLRTKKGREWLARMPYSALIVGVVVPIGVLFAINLVPKEQYSLKHLLALVYALTSCLLLASLVDMFPAFDVIRALFGAITALLVVGIVGHLYGNRIGDSLASWIAIGGVLFLLFEMVALWFGAVPSSWITLVGLLVVMALVALFGRRLREKAENCEADGGPDYPEEGLSGFVFLKNIFVRLLALRGRTGR